jgi:hypothetical protein
MCAYCPFSGVLYEAKEVLSGDPIRLSVSVLKKEKIPSP